MKNIKIILLSFLFICCYDREAKINNKELTGHDFRLFQGTAVWILAKAVEDEDSVTMKKIILKEKPNLDFKESKFGNTLLMLAVVKNKYDSAKILLDAGASPNTSDTFRGTTAVIDAAGNDDPKYLKLLLSHGGNPNALENVQVKENDSARTTALSKAISNLDPASLEKVQLLVEAGADMNYSNEGNPAYTTLPLGAAFKQDKLDVALYLLQKGADYKKVMYVMVDNHKVYILEALRKCTIDLESKQYKSKLEVIQFLKEKGLDYSKEPIPEYILKDIKKKYPKDWEDYIKKY